MPCEWPITSLRANASLMPSFSRLAAASATSMALVFQIASSWAIPAAADIGGRAQAIAEAVNGLGPEDLLVVAGKGHEQGQIIGEETRPFDDAEAVGAALKEIGK